MAASEGHLHITTGEHLFPFHKGPPRGSSGARLEAGPVRLEVRRASPLPTPPAPPGRCTDLDVWTQVHVTGPQVAEAALLLGPAVAVGVGDASRDPQAAGGGAGTPGARVGQAVPVPRLCLTCGR